jgi:hypothetical protein
VTGDPNRFGSLRATVFWKLGGVAPLRRHGFVKHFGHAVLRNKPDRFGVDAEEVEFSAFVTPDRTRNVIPKAVLPQQLGTDGGL